MPVNLKTVIIISIAFFLHVLSLVNKNLYSHYSNPAVSLTDTDKVYLALIGKINNQGKRILISPNTDPREIRTFSFRHPENYLLGTSAFTLTKDSSWKLFLDGIDTSLVPRSYTISKELEKQKQVKLFSSTKTQKSSPDHSYGLIYFSPVIFSKNRKKSVCTMKIIRGAEEVSTIMFFLTKEKNEWTIITHILLSIS